MGRRDPRLGSLVGQGPRASGGLAPARPSVLAGCFPEALALIRDPSPMKAVLATRRSAKSYSCFLEVVDDLLNHPRCNGLVVGLTRSAIKRVFWNDIAGRVNREFRLGMRANKSDLSLQLPNESVIYFLGMDSHEDEHRKALGVKTRKILVDEAQDFATDLESLIFKVLLPTTIDEASRGSSITLCGTPGNRTNGYFAQVTRGCRAGYVSPPEYRTPGWSVHSWTTLRNPWTAKEFQQTIDRLVAANPLVEQASWFQQMYRGVWVVDLSDRVYAYDPALNSAEELPRYDEGSWHFGLGLDLGHSPDPCAFVVGAWHDFDPTLYLVESWKQWEMDFTDVAKKVHEYEARYSLEFAVVDAANKQGFFELNRRHNLNLIPAKKVGKEEAQRLMSDDFKMGRIRLLPGCNQGVPRRLHEGQRGVRASSGYLSLADEYLNLVWDEKLLAAPHFKHVEHAGCENHGADAALYLHRRSQEYLASKPDPEPALGTPEWLAAQEDAMFEGAIAEAQMRLGDDPEEARLASFHGMPVADRERVGNALAAMEHAQDGSADDEEFLH